MKKGVIKVQQFHKSRRAAEQQIKGWNKDFRSSWNQDYGDYDVVDIRRAYQRADDIGAGGNRNLYDITLKKRRK